MTARRGAPARAAALLLLVPGLAVAGDLPEGTARWRMELAGAPVGAVELTVRCDGPACVATWTSRQRLPGESGGGLATRRAWVPVDRAGRATGAARTEEDGRARQVALPPGAVPAMLAEVLLSAPGAPPCLDTADERTGAAARTCARPGGAPGELVVEVNGEPERVIAGAGPFPAELALPAQRVRFVLDAGAAPPIRPPRLFGVEVPGPADPSDAATFCGRKVDAVALAGAAGGLPRAEAVGASCREQARAWAEGARRRGIPARVAVGVAWDGGAYVWHAWAQAQVGGRWVAVDPAFRQAPARGARFTLASYEPEDEAGRLAAGRRILECWGRAAVKGR